MLTATAMKITSVPLDLFPCAAGELAVTPLREENRAEVLEFSPDVNYLEGIFVDPDERGRGYGLECLSQLTRMLLRHKSSVCLLVNQRNTAAQAFYRKAGFKFRCMYDTTFF